MQKITQSGHTECYTQIHKTWEFGILRSLSLSSPHFATIFRHLFRCEILTMRQWLWEAVTKRNVREDSDKGVFEAHLESMVLLTTLCDKTEMVLEARNRHHHNIRKLFLGKNLWGYCEVKCHRMGDAMKTGTTSTGPWIVLNYINALYQLGWDQIWVLWQRKHVWGTKN